LPFLTPYFDSDGDNTAQAMKVSGGEVRRLHVVNLNTADAYFQLFDAATSGVTVGTTVPVQSYLVPGGNGTNSGGLDITLEDGIKFETAITYACTTTAAGGTDPTTGLVVNALYR